MAKVKDVVNNLIQILEMREREAERRVEVIHKMHAYLVEKSRALLEESLDRLLGRVSAEEATKIGGTVVVLISPEGRVTLEKTHGDKEIDPYLTRLMAQHFHVMTLAEFSRLIESAKVRVAEGNLMPVIRFLMANTRPPLAWAYWPAPASKASPPEPSSSAIPEESPPREASSARWKLSDFLPAPFPHLPLPRGLFKE